MNIKGKQLKLFFAKQVIIVLVLSIIVVVPLTIQPTYASSPLSGQDIQQTLLPANTSTTATPPDNLQQIRSDFIQTRVLMEIYSAIAAIIALAIAIIAYYVISKRRPKNCVTEKNIRLVKNKP